MINLTMKQKYFFLLVADFQVFKVTYTSLLEIVGSPLGDKWMHIL